MSNPISYLTSGLQGLLNTFQKERHYKDKSKTDALLAIKKALFETRKYCELHGKGFNREKELEIAELWSEASIMCRNVFEPWLMVTEDKMALHINQLPIEPEELFDKKLDFDSIESLLSDAINGS